MEEQKKESTAVDSEFEGMFLITVAIGLLVAILFGIKSISPELVPSEVRHFEGPQGSFLLSTEVGHLNITMGSMLGAYLKPVSKDSVVEFIGWSYLYEFVEIDTVKKYQLSREWTQSPKIPSLNASVWWRFDGEGKLWILTYADGEVYTGDELKERKIFRDQTRVFELR